MQRHVTREKAGLYSRRDFLLSFTRARHSETRAEPDADPESPAHSFHPAEDCFAGIPEEALREMVPVLRQDLTATVSGDSIRYREPEGEARTLAMGTEVCAIVALFDGQRTVGQIAAALDAGGDRMHGRTAYAKVREAFAIVCEAGIYHPLDGPPRLLSDDPVPTAQAGGGHEGDGP